MKKLLFPFVMTLFVVMTAVSQPTTKPATKKTPAPATKKSAAPVMTSQKDKMSYVIGYDIGKNMLADFKKREFELNNEILIKGLTDALNEKESALSQEETQSTTQVFQQQMMEKQNIESAAARKAGEDFLALNALKEGVTVTVSGLQYKILVEGTGKSPAPTNTVVVHYRGKLIDGTVFDESYSRGEPATFQLNQVIKGWTEGLQLLKEGGKAELYIPAELGYGDRGAGEIIRPGAALIFEVELIKVQ
jgi:FKBP-type peptidyl-prolyl cis-trans isomerase FklB